MSRFRIVSNATGAVVGLTHEDQLPADQAPHYRLVPAPDLSATRALSAHETMALVNATLAKYDSLPAPTARRQRADAHRLMREVGAVLSSSS